jgi:hypothetical protein
VADVENNGLGKGFVLEEVHKAVRRQVCEFSDLLLVFNFEGSYLGPMAGEVEEGGPFEKGILDVGLCGDHHLDPEVESELFLTRVTSTFPTISMN